MRQPGLQFRLGTHFDELRRVSAPADWVAGLTVFDIGGNMYRLSAADYGRGTWKGSNR